MTQNDAVLGVMARRPRASWTVQEICAAVGELRPLSAHDHALWEGQPNYHHWVRSTLGRLKNLGRVERIAWNTYRLSRG